MLHTKQIMEKAYELKLSNELLFIQFQQAFGSFNEEKLPNILNKLKKPCKQQEKLF